ncbi:MAG: alcohol dehydrogenase catalytic domain-containing protein [Solirubrobacterales bacterium]|nr:alcohol dehydrogenase catalytic domain-containing protein [Solirubrobacterales bacterium]
MSAGTHRSRGWARHLAGTLSPIALTASRVALESHRGLRAHRLLDAAGDRLRERGRPTRDRMRALSVSPGARFQWHRVAVPPPPGPDGAIVHPIAIATCDLDRALALGATPFLLPLHFGHECVAEVLQIGDHVTSVRPGDRVIVPFQISCGACSSCRAGLTANCRSVPPISMYGFGVGGGHWGGVVSDQLAVPYADGMLVELPPEIEPSVAASVADNVSDGYRHIGPYLPALLERDPDSEVLIIAARRKRSLYSASVPLYAGLIARALGARLIRFVDARPAVRAEAEQLGLTALPPSEVRGLAPAPLVIDASASARGLRCALTLTAQDGICTSIGGLHTNARIPTGLLYGRNATLLIGRTHARAIIPHVLKLIVDGQLQPQRVTTHLERLDDAPRALREHVATDATKTILVES